MAYVTVPKDLTHVKSKVLFGLTKRQLVCFGGALLTGGPLYFLARNYLSNSAAALLMIFAMLPGLLFALFERHGQPLESSDSANDSVLLYPSQGKALSDQQCLRRPCAAIPNGTGGKGHCPEKRYPAKPKSPKSSPAPRKKKLMPLSASTRVTASPARHRPPSV